MLNEKLIETKIARFKDIEDLFVSFPVLRRINLTVAKRYGGPVAALCHWQTLVMVASVLHWQRLQVAHRQTLPKHEITDINANYQKAAAEANKFMLELFDLTVSESLNDGRTTEQVVGSEDWFRDQFADSSLKYFNAHLFNTEAFDDRLSDSWLHYEEERSFFEAVMLLGINREAELSA